MIQNLEPEIQEVIKTGNWMIRCDDYGRAYRGFMWKPLGEWTEAEHFREDPECGNGLHGINHIAAGYLISQAGGGHRVVFCQTEGPQINLGNKIKVKRARILMVNELPAGLTINGYLYLSNTDIQKLPENLTIKGKLNINFTDIKIIPESLTTDGIFIWNTNIENIPAKFTNIDRRTIKFNGQIYTR